MARISKKATITLAILLLLIPISEAAAYRQAYNRNLITGKATLFWGPGCDATESWGAHSVSIPDTYTGEDVEIAISHRYCGDQQTCLQKELLLDNLCVADSNGRCLESPLSACPGSDSWTPHTIQIPEWAQGSDVDLMVSHQYCGDASRCQQDAISIDNICIADSSGKCIQTSEALCPGSDDWTQHILRLPEWAQGSELEVSIGHRACEGRDCTSPILLDQFCFADEAGQCLTSSIVCGDAICSAGEICEKDAPSCPDKPNTAKTCADGCQYSCNTGWSDCNNDKSTDGCETPTSTDGMNCGKCANACGDGMSCVSGECKPPPPPSGPGTLTINSNVPAEATIDFEPAGTTPITDKSFDPGMHVVTLYKEGFIESTKYITINPDSAQTVDFSLATSPAYLTISSSPDGSNVDIDGVAAGITPLRSIVVTPGAHSLRVYRSGYKDSVQQPTARPGQDTAVSVTLAQDPAEFTRPKVASTPLDPAPTIGDSQQEIILTPAMVYRLMQGLPTQPTQTGVPANQQNLQHDLDNDKWLTPKDLGILVDVALGKQACPADKVCDLTQDGTVNLPDIQQMVEEIS